MPVLKTINGNFHYKTYPLYVGIKKINKVIAKGNLLLFKEILDSNNINFGLIAGTLLGAVREHDFIEHDEDIDIFFKEEDKASFLCIIPQLLEVGFEIARYDRRGLMSFIRSGEYIDLYFFSNFKNGIRSCSGWCIPDSFLIDTDYLFFQGEQFLVPKNYISYLEYEYGKDWRTPVIYADFNMSSWQIFLLKIKEKIKDILPDCIYFYFAHISEKKMRKRYLEKIETWSRI